jgi:uncharacterized integral membrane protein (TIGR00697 family)
MRFRYLDLITASFVAVLLISNIASTKIVDLGRFTFDGGTLLFPLAYIFGDILTEVYGYSRSRRVIWTGFAWIAIAAGVFALVDALPAAPDYELQESFSAILGQTPRIVAGSLAAFLAGEFVNSVILARLKVRTNGRFLWSRTISSTVVGQAVDTVVFVLIAFGGLFSAGTIWEIISSKPRRSLSGSLRMPGTKSHTAASVVSPRKFLLIEHASTPRPYLLVQR